MFIEPHDVELRWHLKMLRGMLKDTTHVDSPTQEALVGVATEIDRLLERQAKRDEWSQVGNQWREVVLDFESRHPQLTKAVEEVTGILANAGI